MTRIIPDDIDVDSFTSKVALDEETNCWVWKLKPTDTGYGIYNTHSKVFKAHRVSWRIFKGPLTDGLVIDHMCKNRMCVNPAHLREVDSHTNTMENSNWFVALNKLKTHCPSGHEYTEENTRLKPQTINPELLGRQCKECTRIFQNKKYHKNKEAISLKRKEIYRLNAKANRERIYERRRLAKIRELF